MNVIIGSIMSIITFIILAYVFYIKQYKPDRITLTKREKLKVLRLALRDLTRGTDSKFICVLIGFHIHNAYPKWGSALDYPDLALKHFPELLNWKPDDVKKGEPWWNVTDKATRIMVLELLILEIKNS